MKILFVCTANIFRSALAEVILRKKLQEKGLTDIEVDSAGVHNYAGEPRDYMMCSYARKAGYEMGSVKNKPILQTLLSVWSSSMLLRCKSDYRMPAGDASNGLTKSVSMNRQI